MIYRKDHKGLLQTMKPVQFLQTRGPYIYRQGRKGPHKQGAPTEQRALTDAVQFLQKRSPYKQGPPNMIYSQGALLEKGSIQARGHNISITAIQISRK